MFRKLNFLFVLFSFFFLSGYCQDQKVADSLKKLYRAGGDESIDLQLLEDITHNETKPDSSLKYSEILISKAIADSNFQMVYTGYLKKGAALRLKGDYEKSLQALFKCMDYARKTKDEGNIAACYISIGNVYSTNQNSSNADVYYKKGLEILRKANDSLRLGKALYNSGDELLRLGELSRAKNYTEEASIIFEKVAFPLGQAYCLGNLGRIFAKSGDDVKAEKYLDKAINMLEDYDNFNAISEFLTYMADIYLEKGDEEKALEYAERSLDLAHKYDLKDRISASNLKLSELYEAIGDTAKSFKYYKDYITFRDSVTNLESIRQMADLRTDFEVSQKQAEVDLLNQQRKNQRIIVIATIVALFLILLLAVGLYRRNQFIKRTNLIIEKEKDRSEHLLLNILPEETAQELKESGRVKAKRFDAVSVLFTDFQGFTHYAENLAPEKLVKRVDFYFSKFDEIVERYGLEKIKTIGDSYMCAAGVPFPVDDHAVRIVSASLEMLSFVEGIRKDHSDEGTYFDVRIGINSGPVIAGVVGNKKFAYDIWGDTVNIASRMETCSERGMINISENTYNLVKDSFICEYRGEFEVKNKGPMKMYFVKGSRKDNV